jgi:hypothetical protein
MRIPKMILAIGNNFSYNDEKKKNRKPFQTRIFQKGICP